MKSDKRLKDTLAEKEITSFIVRQKERGVSEVSILDISDKLKLPLGQIDRVMGKFEEEGKVEEI